MLATRVLWVLAFALLGLDGCAGAHSRSSPARDAGPPHDEPPQTEDAALALDAGPQAHDADASDSWDAGDASACRITFTSPAKASYTSSTARVTPGGTEIPFVRFLCDRPSGEPYRVEIDLTGEAQPEFWVYDSRSPQAVSAGVCSSEAVLRDGVPISFGDLFGAPDGLITIRIDACMSTLGSEQIVFKRALVQAHLTRRGGT